MDKINQAIARILFWCITLTVTFVAGPPMLIIGAINHLWVLLAFGIAFTVTGFFGTSLIWVFYGERRGYRRIVIAVESERLYSVNAIAEQLNLTTAAVREKLDVCFRRGYISGYVREGDVIRKNVNAYADTQTFKCQACGAPYECKITEVPKCPYCGTGAKV